jgi:hypothetical protein
VFSIIVTYPWPLDPESSRNRVRKHPTRSEAVNAYGPAKRHEVQSKLPYIPSQLLLILGSVLNSRSLAVDPTAISQLNIHTRTKMAAAASVYPPLNQRPVKNTVLLFDVDDTLTKPRQVRKETCL